MKILFVVYDNDSYIHWFPQGIAAIAAVLIKAGHEVHIYNQDLNHYPEEHLTEYLDKNGYDMVGLGVIAGYYQYKKLLSISRAVNASRNRPVYVIGGHGPSPEPEFFLNKTGADAAVIGEGEVTVVELAEAISNKRPLKDIAGIAYRDGGKVVINPRRPLVKNIDTLPFPAYELFPMEYYRLLRGPHISSGEFALPVLSGRGCTFTCTFCYRMDEGFRPRSAKAIIEEALFLKDKYGITYLLFSDELLMSSPDRTVSICEAFLKAKLGMKWTCNGRLNFARPEVLDIMKKSGCVFINYGIEAMDDVVLKNMKKALNTDTIVKGIEATLKAGISPGLNVIFGNIGDNKETLQKGVEFLLKYDDGAQLRTIRPVTPYPGSQLYYEAIRRGLIKDCEDFYTRHVNSDLLTVNFTELTDDEFHRALLEANARLLKNYYARKMELSLKEMERLYIGRDAGFRGFRHT